jgi:hypothetical protein
MNGGRRNSLGTAVIAINRALGSVRASCRIFADGRANPAARYMRRAFTLFREQTALAARKLLFQTALSHK